MKLSNQIIELLKQKLHVFHKNSPAFLQWAETPVHVGLSDEVVEAFLNVFLEKTQTESAARALALKAIEADIPYALMMADINLLKQEIVRHYKGQADNPFDLFEQVDEAFEKTKNAIAHYYLLDEAERNGIFPDARQVEQQRLLKLYDEWFAQLRKAIAQEDIAAFRTLAQRNEAFVTALHDPETLMVCMDAVACGALKESHDNVMRMAVSVFHKVSEHQFEQALLLFLQLRAAVEQLAVLISTLYFNYKTNQLSVFLRLLEQLPMMRKNIRLTMLNIEGMKQVNELYGEEMGDGLLAALQEIVNQRMQACPAHLAFAPGVNGDFYLVFVEQTGEQIEAHLQAIEQVLNEKAEAMGLRRVQVNSVTVPLDEITLRGRAHFRRLFNRMHQLRETGRHVFIENGAELNAFLKNQLEQAVNIKQLLEEDALEIYLQPLINTHSGQIAGFEVLGRLVTPEGVLSAGLFIDKMVELGIIEEFDCKVVEQIAKYAEKLELVTSSLFVNVSPRSLASKRYIQTLAQVLKHEAGNLNFVLELTEQTALNHEDILIQLHEEEGLVFAIDDFGAGYSSLEMVVRLSDMGVIQYLKIDGSITKSAVLNPTAHRVLEIIQQMAGSLSLLTVAEFIESQNSMTMVEDLGIDYGQGYFLGKPDAVEAWMAYRLFSKQADQSRFNPVKQ